MEDKDMSPEEWRQEKDERWHTKRVPFSSKEKQQRELEKIVASIKYFIKKDQETPKGWEDDPSANEPPEYWVKAVIIWGSWAQGAAAKSSDIDIAFICEYKYAEHDIDDYIAEDVEDKTGYFVDTIGGRINWDNEAKLKSVINGEHELFGKDIIIVTPFEEVKERILSLNPTTRIV
jgi:predicted nucleotidyltransferase